MYLRYTDFLSLATLLSRLAFSLSRSPLPLCIHILKYIWIVTVIHIHVSSMIHIHLGYTNALACLLPILPVSLPMYLYFRVYLVAKIHASKCI